MGRWRGGVAVGGGAVAGRWVDGGAVAAVAGRWVDDGAVAAVVGLWRVDGSMAGRSRVGRGVCYIMYIISDKNIPYIKVALSCILSVIKAYISNNADRLSVIKMAILSLIT